MIVSCIILYSPEEKVEFPAVLNGNPFSDFHPIAGASEIVTILLSSGRNTLLLSVDGVRPDGRIATDRAQLMFIVP